MPPLRDAHAFEISPGVRMPRLGLGTFKVRGEDATRARPRGAAGGLPPRRHSVVLPQRGGYQGRGREGRTRRKAAARADDASGVLDEQAGTERDGRPGEDARGASRRARAARSGDARRRKTRGRDKGLTETRLVPKPLDLVLVHWPAKAGAASGRRVALRRAQGRVAGSGAREGRRLRPRDRREQLHARALGRDAFLRRETPPLREPGGAPPAVPAKRAPRGVRRATRRRRAYSPLGCGALLEDPRVVRCAARLAAELELLTR